MDRPQILVVDDDPNVLRVMKRGLVYAGYNVDEASTGESALATARERPPDLVVLDVMLPGVDGLEVCRRLRLVNPQLPILLLTARDRVPDRVAGLDAGADDYLVKPFAFDELLARVRALLRRSRAAEGEVYRHADLTINPATREVRRGDRPIELTAREYDLLEFLTRHARQVFGRETIFERVWGSDYMGESNVIDVVVMRLREKLEMNGEPRLIQTVRGVGYTLREPNQEASRS
ncbi:MAG TPA: response regulator transcription factor [Chloroflexota bacterium]|nr:response regulator transcription factor [Chloroflexota bacterium]